MKTKFVTFGELLLRFSKLDHQRLSQGDYFTSKYGGSEANVAVSLATLGNEVEYITRLPETPVGHAGAQNLMQLGVGCHYIQWGGQRIGTYYMEPAAGMRSAKVIYDRANSACSELKPGMIPWREILKDASVLHVSGITAAISQSTADATFEALDIADEMGVKVAFDINYRKNLWKYGADPRETLKRMLSRCDLMFGDAIEFEWICERKQPPFTALDSNFEMQMDEYREWFEDLHREFPRCKKWLMGMRNMVASNHHLLTALLYTAETSDGPYELLKAPINDINGVVDPSGVGDAFMAGLLHAVTAYPHDNQLQVDYALAASTLKNTIPGDFNLATDEEILELIQK
ncbi:sugar kinase [uncultured Prevotella sp.]|jgi:2-dehydro-3-deoxygluconokinase|uniref:sugar kinase n=1 Tax=uncultured Prevotella sp. TaxID=159272 RepID=UPI0025E18C26|nr:sugar kinase [uncultured Prevotella sp.]